DLSALEDVDQREVIGEQSVECAHVPREKCGEELPVGFARSTVFGYGRHELSGVSLRSRGRMHERADRCVSDGAIHCSVTESLGLRGRIFLLTASLTAPRLARIP